MANHPLEDILIQIAQQQAEDKDDNGSSDAILTFDLGARTEVIRGSFNVGWESRDIAVWPRVYYYSGKIHRASDCSDHSIPDDATETLTSEIPKHYLLDRLVAVEWAVNDYEER